MMSCTAPGIAGVQSLFSCLAFIEGAVIVAPFLLRFGFFRRLQIPVITGRSRHGGSV